MAKRLSRRYINYLRRIGCDNWLMNFTASDLIDGMESAGNWTSEEQGWVLAGFAECELLYREGFAADCAVLICNFIMKLQRGAKE